MLLTVGGDRVEQEVEAPLLALGVLAKPLAVVDDQHGRQAASRVVAGDQAVGHDVVRGWVRDAGSDSVPELLKLALGELELAVENLPALTRELEPKRPPRLLRRGALALLTKPLGRLAFPIALAVGVRAPFPILRVKPGDQEAKDCRLSVGIEPRPPRGQASCT